MLPKINLYGLQAPWLDDAIINRYALPECVEVRTWEQIARELQSDTSFTTGTLKPEYLPDFEVWGCWKHHSCLSKFQHASADDAMCYVFDETKSKWLAWGLQSEVFKCAPL